MFFSVSNFKPNNNLKNAFNQRVGAGGTARTVPEKEKRTRGNKKKREACRKRNRNKKRAARNQAGPWKNKNWGTGKKNRNGR